MYAQPPSTTERLASFVAWLTIILHAAASLFALRPASGGKCPAVERLARMVRDTIAIRAADFLCVQPSRRAGPAHAPPGFARRSRPRQILRAAAGSWLRRRLRHTDPVRRIAILIEALCSVDALARAVARRAPCGLTRLRPLILTQSPCDPVRTLFSPAPPAADTS